MPKIKGNLRHARTMAKITSSNSSQQENSLNHMRIVR